MARILVVGSVARDEVVQLDGPLRAGGHNQGRWCGERLGGGAANTAVALARAGDRAVVISAVGRDSYGECLRRELDAAGVDLSRLSRDAVATTRSLVLIDASGERTIVNLARARVPLPGDLASLPAECLYARSADPALAPIMAQRAEWGTVVAHVPPVHAGGLPAQILVGSAADLDDAFLADPFAAGRRIAGKYLQWMVITHGAEGAVAHGASGALHVRAPRVRVVDSTGAGDVFAAGLLHGLGRGEAMEIALGRAVAWGSAAVCHAGSIPPEDFHSGV